MVPVFEGRAGGRMYEAGARRTGARLGDDPRLRAAPPHRARVDSQFRGAPPGGRGALYSDGNGTRVELEHRGWERDQGGGAEERGSYDSGWSQCSRPIPRGSFRLSRSGLRCLRTAPRVRGGRLLLGERLDLGLELRVPGAQHLELVTERRELVCRVAGTPRQPRTANDCLPRRQLGRGSGGFRHRVAMALCDLREQTTAEAALRLQRDAQLLREHVSSARRPAPPFARRVSRPGAPRRFPARRNLRIVELFCRQQAALDEESSPRRFHPAMTGHLRHNGLRIACAPCELEH